MAAHLIESLWVTGLGPSAASGYVFFYQPGTQTPVSVYSNDAATSVVTQPVRLDANGRSSSPLYLKAPARLIVQTANQATLLDVERIDGHRAELVALANPLWPNESSDNAAWTALATSLGGTDGSVKVTGTGSVARSAQSKLTDQISVKDFGAIGNGIADDTAPIVAAITSASLLSAGATILVPPGTYLISQPITFSNNVSLQGANRTSSIIKNTSATGNALTVGGATGVVLSNLTVTNSSTSTGTAITYAGALSIVGCSISGHRIGVSGGGGSAALSVTTSDITCDGNAAASCMTITSGNGFVSSCTLDSGSASLGTCINSTGVLQALGGTYRALNAFTFNAGTAAVLGAYAQASTNLYTIASGTPNLTLVGCTFQNEPAISVNSVVIDGPQSGAYGDAGPINSQSFGVNSAYTPIPGYRYHVLTATAPITMTINAPSAMLVGAPFTIVCVNSSGGAVIWTFGGNYKVATVNPGTGFGIGVTFLSMTGLTYREISRGSAA